MAEILIHVPVHGTEQALRFEATLNQFAETLPASSAEDDDTFVMVRTDYVGGQMRKTVVFQKRADADSFRSLLAGAGVR